MSACKVRIGYATPWENGKLQRDDKFRWVFIEGLKGEPITTALCRALFGSDQPGAYLVAARNAAEIPPSKAAAESQEEFGIILHPLECPTCG